MKSVLTRSFVCYPIFPFFVATILGTSVVRIFPELRTHVDVFVSCAIAIFVIDFASSCFSYFGFPAKTVRITRRIFRAIAFGFICSALAFVRIDVPTQAIFPPTEVVLDGEILEVSQNSNGTLYGILRVVNSTKKSLDNAKVWFTFAEPKKEILHNILSLRIGDVVRVKTPVRSVVEKPPLAWGYVKDSNSEKSFNKYLHSRFVFFKCFAYYDSVEILSQRTKLFWGEKIANYIRKTLSCEDGVLDKSASGALRAMVLGDKAELTEQQKQNFKSTGTMHIFAVSGLHVGVVALGLYFFCSMLGVPFVWRAIVVLPILFLYVLACGLPPSAVRAFLMVAVFWIAFAFSRGSAPMNALMLSAIVAILISPKVMFSAGFQLSYAVVGALFAWSIPVAKLFEINFNKAFYSVRFFNFYKRLFRFLVFGLCMSIGASCVACPISAYWFGAFSVSGIFVSPIFVLLASCSVILAMISLLPTGLGFLFVSVAIFCVDIMQTLAKIIVEIMPMYISMKINNGLLCCLIVILVFSAFIFTQKLNVLLRFCSVVVMVFLVMFLIWISQ